MVDTDSRRIIADSVDAFLRGKIDNWAFDDRIFALRTDDELCLEIRRQLWLCYDDIRRYFNVGENKLNEDVELLLRRWKLILSSEMEWHEISNEPQRNGWRYRVHRFIQARKSPKSKIRKNMYWPLADAKAWERMEANKLTWSGPRH